MTSDGSVEDELSLLQFERTRDKQRQKSTFFNMYMVAKVSLLLLVTIKVDLFKDLDR